MAKLFQYNEVLPWKANELEFHTDIQECLKAVIKKISGIHCRCAKI